MIKELMNSIKEFGAPFSTEASGNRVDTKALARIVAPHFARELEAAGLEIVETKRITELTEQRDELLAVAKEVIEDLAIRAKIDGDDCLNISDGILQRLEEAIAKAEKNAS